MALPAKIKHGLAPVVRANARLIILGSLPGDASLAAQRYYAHPRNQFWRLVGAAVGENLAGLGYEDRLDRLGERRIGLWDVIASAQRRGSLDQSIRCAGHNPLADYVAGLTDLEAVAFNGAAASAAGRKLLGDSSLAMIDLPSSSPANTRAFADKMEAWSAIRQYL